MSFSKTRWETFHALRSFGSTLVAPSRATNSFDLELSFVMEADRSDWQSSLSNQNVPTSCTSEERGVQELPSIRPYTRPVDIVRVPAPDGPETLRLEVQRRLKRRGVMQAEVGAKPVDDARFRSHEVRVTA